MKTGGKVRKYEEGGDVYLSTKDKFAESVKKRLAEKYPQEESTKSEKRPFENSRQRNIRELVSGSGAELPKGMVPGGPKNRNYKTGGPVGLYANIHAKRERIKQGSGEKMRKPGQAGAPTKQAFIESAKTAKKK